MSTYAAVSPVQSYGGGLLAVPAVNARRPDPERANAHQEMVERLQSIDVKMWTTSAQMTGAMLLFLLFTPAGIIPLIKIISLVTSYYSADERELSFRSLPTLDGSVTVSFENSQMSRPHLVRPTRVAMLKPQLWLRYLIIC